MSVGAVLPATEAPDRWSGYHAGQPGAVPAVAHCASPTGTAVWLERLTPENSYRGLSGLLRYLRGKRRELQYLDASDLWMYFTVASLLWHTERTECRLVPLETIKLLHPIVRS